MLLLKSVCHFYSKCLYCKTSRLHQIGQVDQKTTRSYIYNPNTEQENLEIKEFRKHEMGFEHYRHP